MDISILNIYAPTTMASNVIKTKQNITTATYWTLHTDGGRLQYPTLTKRQIIQTKIKQKNAGANWCCKLNWPNRYYRTFFFTQTQKYTFFSAYPPRNVFQNWPRTWTQSKFQKIQENWCKIRYAITVNQTTTDLQLGINNNRHNTKFTNSWQLNNSLLNENESKQKLRRKF